MQSAQFPAPGALSDWAATLKIDIDTLNYLLNIDQSQRLAYIETPGADSGIVKSVLLNLHWAATGAAAQELPHEGAAHQVARQTFDAPGDIPAEVLTAALTSPDYRRVAFVRHPATRLAAVYQDKFFHAERAQHMQALGLAADAEPSFAEVLERIAALPELDRDIHFRSQFHLLGSGQITFQMLGRYETLAEDLTRLAETCLPGRSAELAALSAFAAQTAGRDPWLTIDDRAKTLIAEIYAQDFDLFGYRRDQIIAAVPALLEPEPIPEPEPQPPYPLYGPGEFISILEARAQGQQGGTDLAAFFGFAYDRITRSEAQIFQDLWALFMSGEKKDGFFVEFGACDGRLLSNSLLLERDYGWRGILAEPNIFWLDALRANRPDAIIDNECVNARSGETISLLCVTDQPELSRLRDIAPEDRHEQEGNRENAQLIDVQSVSLNDLLARHDAPRQIDFMSIDTEGSEFEILEAFDFDRWDVRLFAIEHAGEEVKRARILDLLTQKGYARWHPEFSRWDDWYVKEA